MQDNNAKVALIQYKQNWLYDFPHNPIFTSKERIKLKNEIMTENLGLIKDACIAGADIILTSEAINFTGVPVDNETFNIIEDFKTGESFKKISQLSAEYNNTIIAGLLNRREDKAYNSAVVFQSGRISCVYDKINLAGDENLMLTPGKDYCVFDSKIGKIGLLVCFDMQHPNTVDELSQLGIDYIFCPTWGWENQYGLDCAMRNKVKIAVAMAVPYKSIDNGIISGVRSPSMLVSESGEILAQASREKPQVLYLTNF